MIARIRKDLDNKEKGFTLIELLVVIIIIGILAAIAIPLFLNQRKKAEDSAAKADVSTIGKEIATWFVDSTVDPTLNATETEYFLAETSTTDADAKIGNRSTNVDVEKTIKYFDEDSHSTSWCVHVTNKEGDVAKDTGFQYSASSGLKQGKCADEEGEENENS